jgi:hypothetical protein
VKYFVLVLCSEDIYFNAHLAQFKEYLLMRGYTESFIADIYNNFYIPDRRTLIYDRLDKNKHNVVTTNPLTLCTTYSHIIKHILDYSLITPGEITRQFEVDHKQLFNKERIIFKNKPNLTLLLTDYSHTPLPH